MLRRPVPILLLPVLLIAGCGSAAPPQVTFGVAGQQRTTGPTQYCDLRLANCRNDAGAVVTLPVPAGTSVRIDVPDPISTTPWTVVFSYRGPDGAAVDDRTRVFAPGTQQGYTLTLPDPADRLATAQVQQLGAAPVLDPKTGELDFPVRSTWVLQAGSEAL